MFLRRYKKIFLNFSIFQSKTFCKEISEEKFLMLIEMSHTRHDQHVAACSPRNG